MDEESRELVRQRAGERCEYCGLRQDHSPLTLQIEHITARKHGGGDDPSNLALACDRCNVHKGPNLVGIDPETDQITPLFHPRLHSWADHFEMSDILIVGRTAIGRATVRVLNMNEARRLRLRAALRDAGELD